MLQPKVESHFLKKALSSSCVKETSMDLEGLVVGEDPKRDVDRFRRTDRGICLITQAMIDRLQ